MLLLFLSLVSLELEGQCGVAMNSLIDSSQETKISTEASVTHGIVSGVYYGSVWGICSYWLQDWKNVQRIFQLNNITRRGDMKIACVRCARYTGYSVVGFASFLALFKGTNSILVKQYPSFQYRPLFDGFSASSAAFVPLLFESKNLYLAGRDSLVFGSVIGIGSFFLRSEKLFRLLEDVSE